MTTATPGTLALRLSGITKRFPGVTALDAVDLDLHRGEIHALLGENGAGKSTLIKVLCGIHSADDGDFLMEGSRVAVATPRDAVRLGITVVPQDILMVPQLSIGRNILLGQEGALTRRGRLDKAEKQAVDAVLAKVGASFEAATITSTLSVPHLRLAQIARALVHPSEIMILDEPTAVLSEPDAEHLLERLQQFRAEGKAILYVTHRLSEVMRLADRITILRDGKQVGIFQRGEITREGIVQLMAKESTGERPLAVNPPPTSNGPAGTAGGVHLRVTDLSSGRRFQHVSLSAPPGRIIGIAGVQGSGHGQFLRAVAGVDTPEEGSVSVDGKPLQPGSVRQAVRDGVLFVPADRRGAAIVPHLPVRSNLAISGRIRRAARRYGLRWPGKERAMTQGYIERLSIRPPLTEARIGTLSGGNQQKVALARVLESNARVILIEEPTQGVDVNAKGEIHELLRRVAIEKGCPVVIATSEFEELIGLADEVHVMREGRIVASFPGPEATYRRILENALS